MRKNNTYAPPDWDFQNNWLVGTRWQVQGSNQNTYSVSMTNRGFVCDCTGFVFRGNCKHTKKVAQAFDEKN